MIRTASRSGGHRRAGGAVGSSSWRCATEPGTAAARVEHVVTLTSRSSRSGPAVIAGAVVLVFGDVKALAIWPKPLARRPSVMRN